jgi:hypothetical protein
MTRMPAACSLRVRSVIGIPGRPKIVSRPLSFSASMTRLKPSISCCAPASLPVVPGAGLATAGRFPARRGGVVHSGILLRLTGLMALLEQRGVRADRG